MTKYYAHINKCCNSLYVKHDEDFKILRIWQNVSLHTYDPVQ